MEQEIDDSEKQLTKEREDLFNYFERLQMEAQK